MSKPGRPRQFKLETALEEASKVFWSQGYSATSMDDLGTAMAMNRPSIYNAFGNKQALYRQSLTQFCGQLDAGIEACLSQNNDLRKGLSNFFEQAIAIYCANEPSLGCLMICTAPAESINSPEIKSDLANLIKRVDKTIAQHIQKAIDDGQLRDSIDVDLLAAHLKASLHIIAIRSRAGASKQSLRKYASFAVQQLPWT